MNNYQDLILENQMVLDELEQDVRKRSMRTWLMLFSIWILRLPHELGN